MTKCEWPTGGRQGKSPVEVAGRHGKWLLVGLWEQRLNLEAGLHGLRDRQVRDIPGLDCQPPDHPQLSHQTSI